MCSPPIYYFNKRYKKELELEISKPSLLGESGTVVLKPPLAKKKHRSWAKASRKKRRLGDSSQSGYGAAKLAIPPAVAKVVPPAVIKEAEKAAPKDVKQIAQAAETVSSGKMPLGLLIGQLMSVLPPSIGRFKLVLPIMAFIFLSDLPIIGTQQKMAH